MFQTLLFLWVLLMTSGLFAATSVQGSDLFTSKGLSIEFASAKKGTVLVFVSATCPCSLSHHSHLQELSEKFPDFEFVGIHSNADESLELTRETLKGHLKFKLIQDSDSVIAEEYKALKTPHAFVLDQSGKILYRGGVSSSADFARSNKFFLKDALNDIQAGKPLRLAEGRPLGCIITRASR